MFAIIKLRCMLYSACVSAIMINGVRCAPKDTRLIRIKEELKTVNEEKYEILRDPTVI